MWMTRLMSAVADYGYDMDMYGESVDINMAGAGAVLGSLMVFAAVMWLISMVIVVISLVANWKLFVKAGKPGWAALIPIYNMYVMFDMVYPGSGIKFLLLLVPFYNIYVMIKFYIDLAKAFGKEPVFAVGLIFLNIIFLCILAFGSAQYQLNGGLAMNTKPYEPQMSREEALAKLREKNKPPFEG